MDIRRTTFYVNSAWQCLNGLLHTVHGPTFFAPLVSSGFGSVLPTGFMAVMQGNYYCGGVTILLSSYFHYRWAQRFSTPTSADDGKTSQPGSRKEQTPPTRQAYDNEVRVFTTVSACMYAVLSLWYRQHGELGASYFVTLTALLQSACAVLAW